MKDNYDNRGFASLTREEKKADAFNSTLSTLMDSVEQVEAWFADYDLTNPAQALELGCALLKAANWPVPCKVASQYSLGLDACFHDSVDDFFGYYGCDTECASELTAIIDENNTPLAFESFKEYCIAETNIVEIERTLSWGEP